ncbi:unnamed protein product [Paramecium pentaurelia]|uniref:RRM domain-containing protein n=1 Tax=Paramecium pentaurelia TaxID=43138 RepID=A0A8S1W6G7_9CILI|nr:unnamed protein product [Paramecium pentaurelia]
MLNNSFVSHQFQNSPPQYPLPVANPAQPISARQKIHVSNLPLNVTTQQLQQTFQTYGNIIDIRIIRKTPTGLPLHISCYAFIAFADNDAADKAIQDGRIGDWTVKPQIDKQAIPKCKSRSRSRSRSQEKNKQVLTNGPITPLEQSPKIQIQLYVRELFVSGISKNYDELKIRQIFSQFGSIERIDLYPNKHNIFNSYIKFFTIDQAISAYQKMDSIQQQFSTQIKIYFSDPIKRHNIVGNNLSNEQHSKLSSVLFIFFPPNLNKKVDHAFLFEICQNQQCRPLLWNYIQQDPNYKSYTLLQFRDTKQAIQIRNYLQQHLVDLLGDSKCEVGIVSLPKMPMQPPQQLQQYQPIQMLPQQPLPNNMMMMPPVTQPFQPSYQPLFIPQQVMYQQPLQPFIIHKQERRPQHQYVDPTQFNMPLQMQPQEQELKIKFNPNGNQEILDGFLNFDTNQQLQQQQQRQDWDTFWSGFMFRSKSHKVGVDAKCQESEAPIVMAPQIQVNYKGNFTDAKKSANEAFKFILCPSDYNQNSAFQEYIDYFSEKNKIGVAYIGNSILYLLPPNEITNTILPIQGLEILALYIEDKKKIINYNQDHIL